MPTTDSSPRNQLKLMSHIVSLSKSSTFDEARLEWVFTFAEISAELQKCPCGQRIRECCHLRNSITNNFTIVGNTCVRRFMGQDYSEVFQGVKRIANNLDVMPDQRKRANTQLILESEQAGLITKGESDFLLDIRSKRHLTEKQANWELSIHRKMLCKPLLPDPPEHDMSAFLARLS